MYLALILQAEAAIVLPPAEAIKLVETGALVLDTRSPLDFSLSHLPNSVRVDWRIGTVGGLLSGKLGDPSTVAAQFAALGVDRSRPILIVGDWLNGWGEEGRVAWDLIYLGHPNTHVLQGGYSKWPTTTAYPPTQPASFPANPNEEIRATPEEVKNALLLDVREPEEYSGSVTYGAAHPGHIPGAINLPWKTSFSQPIPFSTQTQLVVYCTGGVRSAMAWVWLTDLGYEVANYDGSWWEWARLYP
jgi:thiosulfate/3-mercaptopyruvate sulfurtransferase